MKSLTIVAWEPKSALPPPPPQEVRDQNKDIRPKRTQKKNQFLALSLFQLMEAGGLKRSSGWQECNCVCVRVYFAVNWPEPVFVFVTLVRSTGIDSHATGPLRQPPIWRTGPPGYMAESIPWNRFLRSLNIYKFGLSHLWKCIVQRRLFLYSSWILFTKNHAWWALWQPGSTGLEGTDVLQ